MKLKEKIRAIRLRKKGLSYNEILQRVPVAKSTLSLWLRSVGLSKRQKQRLTLKKLKSIHRGHKKWREMRQRRKMSLIEQARKEIARTIINKNMFHIIGVMLYWAEGAKEKEYKPGSGVIFSNSDPQMIRIFLKWLRESVKINKTRIKVNIVLHENHIYRASEVEKYWSKVTGFPASAFGKIYIKKHNVNTKRKKTGKSYYGLVRIRVTKSSDLNRRIVGWTKGIIEQCGMVQW